MGKKGGRRHLKRKPAPEFWPVHRKEAVWTIKPDSGPHPVALSLPLTLIIRDILGLAKTRGEVKAIVSGGKIVVDGKVQRDDHFPAGLMDVLSLLDTEKRYRVLPSEKGLALHPIDKDEAGIKLCRIENKTILDDGNVQLNLHDGRNILVKVKDANRHEEDVFKTLDTVEINLSDHQIQGHFRLAEGSSAIIMGGKNIGRHGKIVSLEHREGQKRRKALVTIEDQKGNRFQTTIDYAFVVGDAKPHISLPEVP